MTTVTISRQLGSLGTEIGRRVADHLGFRLVWREVINEAAMRAGAPEVALATIDDLGLLDLHPSEDARKAYHGAAREVLEDLAAEGEVVILGRAGQVVLADRPNVLHVRIIAPPEMRVQRVASRQGIASAAARAQVEQSDQSRRAYVLDAYDVDWNDPGLYDLVLNTGQMSVALCQGLICEALAGLGKRKVDD